jgi:hypothetical protein
MSRTQTQHSLRPWLVPPLSLLAIVATFWCGSWPALLLLAAASVLHAAARAPVRELLLFTIPGFWLLLQHLSGDRRLFFSWSMGLAACAMVAGNTRSRSARAFAAGTVTVLFLAIRVQQQAPQRVLLVETLAATGILAAAAILGKGRSGRLITEACTVAAASILACFSLAI